MDLATLRAAFKDTRIESMCSIAIVIAEHGGSHYDVRPRHTSSAPGVDCSDIWVFVELQPEESRTWARLAGPWGGGRVGLYVIPRLGAEVIVMRPGADRHADPILIAGLSTGDMPAIGNDMVLLAPNGVVKLGSDAGTVPIALAPNVEARLQALERGHRHYAPSSGGPTSVPILMSTEYTTQRGAGTTASPNPIHGDPGHVHYLQEDGSEYDDPADEPTTNSTAMEVGEGVAAISVEGW